MCYLCRSKLLKKGPQSQLGVNGTHVSLVRILVCVWLGRTRGQRVLAASVCVLWNEPEREGVNECAYDVHLGIQSSRCYIPRWGWVWWPRYMPCCAAASWQSRALDLQGFCGQWILGPHASQRGPAQLPQCTHM